MQYISVLVVLLIAILSCARSMLCNRRMAFGWVSITVFRGESHTWKYTSYTTVSKFVVRNVFFFKEIIFQFMHYMNAFMQ